mgnify:CR=1 FL=1
MTVEINKEYFDRIVAMSNEMPLGMPTPAPKPQP